MVVFGEWLTARASSELGKRENEMANQILAVRCKPRRNVAREELSSPNSVRVYRASPEDVILQLRRTKDYIGIALSFARSISAAIVSGSMVRARSLAARISNAHLGARRRPAFQFNAQWRVTLPSNSFAIERPPALGCNASTALAKRVTSLRSKSCCIPREVCSTFLTPNQL